MTMIGDKTRQTARKQHQCWWCGCGIQPGESYFRWLWNNRVECVPISVHPECELAWKRLPSDETDVQEGEFSRGCTCANGDCRCA